MPGLRARPRPGRPHRAVAPPGRVDDRGQVLAGDARTPRRTRARRGRRSNPGRRWSAGTPSGAAPRDGRTARTNPENRHGTPATFSARRIGSAWPFARTRTAWSRGAAPSAIRRAMSAAIQSASSEPVAKASSRTGAPSSRRIGRRRLTRPGAHLEAVRVVEPDQTGTKRRGSGERAVVAAQDDGPGGRVALLELEDVVDGGATERVDGLVVVADDGDVRGGARRGPSTSSACARFVSWNSSTRMYRNRRRSPARAAGDSRTSRRASATWSPKSMKPLAASSSW